MRKNLSSILLYSLIAVLVICLYLGDFTGLKKLQWNIDDLMYSFRGEQQTASDIVMVNIDDKSLDSFGQWPWSYDVLADLVATCVSGEPKSILIDLDLYSRVSEDTTGHTQILANQVSWAENIVLTYDIATSDYASTRISKPEYLYQSSIHTDSDIGYFVSDDAINIRKLFLPSGFISQYADGMGFKINNYDKDRKIRWAPLVANFEGYAYPSAPLIVAALHLGFSPDDIKVNSGETISFGSHNIPINESGSIFINYKNPGESFTKYSAASILNEEVKAGKLKDKLVIIGLTATDFSERYATPSNPRMHQSEIYANTLDNIIRKNYSRQLNLSAGVNVLILLGFGLFCATTLPRVTIIYRMVILTVCLIILVNLNFILFSSYDLLIRALYLGFEIILFMIASPLLDDSIMHKDGKQKTKSRIKADRETNKAAGVQAVDDAPVRTLIETGDEPYLQKTEMVDTDSKHRDSSPSMLPEAGRMPADAGETSQMDSGPDYPAQPNQEPRHSNKDVASPAAAEPPPPPIESASVNSSEFGSQSPIRLNDTPSIGKTDGLTNLGRYRVLGPLGKGAMGTVYKGVDPAIDRHVALKTIRLDFVSDEAEMVELRDRLFREAQAAGKLSHPNIVTIYDVGSEGSLQYIAMEYLEGQTLEDMIKKRVQFSYKIIANIITQICMALDYAHERGIIHRDIKPANIMVLSNYAIKVMDFGIARVDTSSMTKTGIAMGTPNYIAPELLQGKAVDRRCDIYSLGVVVYELLTGGRPFKGDNLTTLIYSIINDDPPPPSTINDNMPLIFDHIISRALAKNPVDRYQRASDLKMALSDFVGTFGGAKKVGI